MQAVVDKYPRTTYEYGNHVHMCVYSYSTVDEIKVHRHVPISAGACAVAVQWTYSTHIHFSSTPL